MKKRKLPIGGVQTFSTLRNEYDVYIDKTKQVYEMAWRYRAVFLARPRRFGKSLLCSTIESLFRGEKELFDGLFISTTDWEWKEYPVICLDLTGEDFANDGVSALVSLLNNQLDVACENYGITVEQSELVGSRFARVIRELFKKYGPVVVVVDEYDSPLLSTIDQPEISAGIREKLRAFFSVTKQCDRYLRFVFVTGVTKFAKISLFSGFNQPMDISMSTAYCDVCGITHDELEEYFAQEINTFAPEHGGRQAYLEKLRAFYDGYSFTNDFVSVYNTYGILNHFDSSGEFLPYWSVSGEPSFARKYLEAKNIDAIDIENAVIDVGDFGSYRDDTITLFPLLYQAGYLTLSSYNEQTGFYRLNYPNVEVRQSLAKFLANNYSEVASVVRSSTSEELVRSLLNGDMDDFFVLLKTYLSRVDYSLSSKITEYYFEFAVSNIVNMLGLKCKIEVHTSHGRMDCVIFAKNYIYVFEFKVDKPIETALRQLKEKNYAQIYNDSGKKLVEVGVVFSRETRNIIEWKTRQPRP